MDARFEGSSSPTIEQIESVARVTPHTPFNTPAYAAACVSVGKTPCTLLLRAGPNIISGCLGFLEKFAFWRRLLIVTVPRPSEPAMFWDGVWDFCRRQGVWELHVQSFGADAADIPFLPGELNRHSRCEYVLDLTSPNPFSLMSAKRRHDIARARKAGLAVYRTREAEASRIHVKLMQASMQRRRDHGEDVPVPKDTVWFEALLASGAAELFQAIDGGRVFSSAMIVRSSTSAYFESAGTSPDGMRIGASAFLVSETARILREDGVRLFNLGGVGLAERGLRFFKASFGGREVILQAAAFSMVPPVQQKLTTVVKLLHRNPVRFFVKAVGALLVRVDRYIVFSARPAEISQSGGAEAGPQFILRKITDEELAGLGTTSYRIQADRFRRLGFNTAYGLYVEGELVHVAWLIDALSDRRNSERNVKLRLGEGEITHCCTGEEYRGRGFYPLAIRYLCGIASTREIERVFMITGVQNKSSQRGIEKAGFLRCGTVRRITFSFGPRWLSLTWRGHRVGSS